jgi:hypothetical protein
MGDFTSDGINVTLATEDALNVQRIVTETVANVSEKLSLA